jgi:hypothetical protein
MSRHSHDSRAWRRYAAGQQLRGQWQEVGLL